MIAKPKHKNKKEGINFFTKKIKNNQNNVVKLTTVGFTTLNEAKARLNIDNNTFNLINKKNCIENTTINNCSIEKSDYCDIINVKQVFTKHIDIVLTLEQTEQIENKKDIIKKIYRYLNLLKSQYIIIDKKECLYNFYLQNKNKYTIVRISDVSLLCLIYYSFHKNTDLKIIRGWFYTNIKKIFKVQI